MAKGDIYKRQVDPEKKQILFRNVDSALMQMVDECCEIREITRKEWFERTCEEFIHSTMVGIKQVLGDDMETDMAWDKEKIKKLIHLKPKS